MRNIKAPEQRGSSAQLATWPNPTERGIAVRVDMVRTTLDESSRSGISQSTVAPPTWAGLALAWSTIRSDPN